MKTCAVCTHPHREEIEMALLKMSPETSTAVLEQCAKAFDISIEDLQHHALFHTSFDCSSGSDSIVRQIKMREADMLAAMAADQLATVKAVGKRIRRFADTVDGEDVRFEKTLTKPMVDLYNGAGDGLRRTVQTLADVNQLLNGPKDEGLSGLAALAQVLHDSRNRATPTHTYDEEAAEE